MLYAFDVMTGKSLWSRNTSGVYEGSPYSASSPAIANGIVYIGSFGTAIHGGG